VLAITTIEFRSLVQVSQINYPSGCFPAIRFHIRVEGKDTQPKVMRAVRYSISANLVNHFISFRAELR
jgi:hypothetical protein